MRIGVPKEIKTHEYRVGLMPGSVAKLVQALLGRYVGLKVWMRAVQSAAAARARSAAGIKAIPASVSSTFRVVRWKSETSKDSSSCLIRWPRAAGVKPTTLEAARKLRCLAASTKHRSESKSGKKP